jgi:hypothetical protein
MSRQHPKVDTSDRSLRKRSTSFRNFPDGRNPVIFPGRCCNYMAGDGSGPIIDLPSNMPKLARAFAQASLPLVQSMIPANAIQTPHTTRHSCPGNQRPYTPARLCTAVAQSSNATDHLIRIHVTSVSYYCIPRPARQTHEFMSFQVEDTAIPGVKNLIILDHECPESNASGNPPWTGASGLLSSGLELFDNLIPSYLRLHPFPHARFYISENGEQTGLPEALRRLPPPVDVWPVGRVPFPLESLLVLVAMTCSRHLRSHIFTTPSCPQWLPRVVWDAIVVMTSPNDKQLPIKLNNPVIVDDVRGKFTNRLQRFRNEVLRSEQVSHVLFLL